MKQFTRRFVLREDWIKAFFLEIPAQSVLKLNSRKLGRHRRGTVLLRTYSSRKVCNGFEIGVVFYVHSGQMQMKEWKKNRAAYFDHNKLLKMLTEASVKE